MIWQILLLTAGFVVLVAISLSSIMLVNQAREDSAWVVHTVEVEGQISNLLLEIRRAESSARGYLLTQEQRFLAEYEDANRTIGPAMNRLAALTTDNPAQAANSTALRAAVDARVAELSRAVDYVKANDIQGGIEMLRAPTGAPAVAAIRRASSAMHDEEAKLLAKRTASADRSQQLSSWVTTAGSVLVLAFGATSIFLVRRSAKARDLAEATLRDTNLNLEATVEERTADLREANVEIQRFAYIVSHDLRSPLVNIMGFTSELEELRGDIFRRIATLSRPADLPPEPASAMSEPIEPALEGKDLTLATEFSEALGFIKSSIGKMDRLISAILNLTREGRREFKPEQIDTKALIESIAQTVAHQAQEAEAKIEVEALPTIVSDRLALEQIFSNLIDNALKYLRNGVPGAISVRGRSKLGFAVFEIADNGRGIDPKDHERIFDLFRRAGTQDRPGQGIGLAHVRALVRRLGGTMSVTSALDAGSTFTITLPAKWAVANRDAQA
jgi:signal transduction histidine kinase